MENADKLRALLAKKVGASEVAGSGSPESESEYEEVAAGTQNIATAYFEEFDPTEGLFPFSDFALSTVEGTISKEDRNDGVQRKGRFG
jgi:hypothetical protein